MKPAPARSWPAGPGRASFQWETMAGQAGAMTAEAGTVAGQAGGEMPERGFL
jgi:hypothetical protein